MTNFRHIRVFLHLSAGGVLVLVSMWADYILGNPSDWGLKEALALVAGLVIIAMGFITHTGIVSRISTNICLALLSLFVVLALGEVVGIIVRDVWPGVGLGQGIGLMTPAAVHYGRAEQLTTARRQILLETHRTHPERFVCRTPQPPVLPPQARINPPPEKTTRQVAAGATFSGRPYLRYPRIQANATRSCRMQTPTRPRLRAFLH